MGKMRTRIALVALTLMLGACDVSSTAVESDFSIMEIRWKYRCYDAFRAAHNLAPKFPVSPDGAYRWCVESGLGKP